MRSKKKKRLSLKAGLLGWLLSFFFDRVGVSSRAHPVFRSWLFKDAELS